MYLTPVRTFSGGPVLVLASWLGAPVSIWLGSPVFSVFSWFLEISVNNFKIVFISNWFFWNWLLAFVLSFLVGFFLFFDFFLVSVEEQVWHDTPFLVSVQFSSQVKNFSGQEPVDKTNGLWGSVVAWDTDIDVFQGGVAINKRDYWDVDVAGFSDGLVVNGWVGDDDESWFSVARLGVIGEGTWAESAVDGGSAKEFSEFENGSLTLLFSRNEADIFGIFDGGDDSGGELDFLPHSADIEHVGAGGFVSFEDVLGHLVVAVGATKMSFRSEQLSGIAGVEFHAFVSVGHFFIFL